MTHFKLTDETKEYLGHTLYRVKLTKDHPVHGKDGTKGGWVIGEHCINDDAWIYDEAMCMSSKGLYDNSKMFDNSKMHENSTMYGNSKMYGNSEMFDNSKMHENSTMYGNSEMHDNSEMCDNSQMHGNSEMFDNSKMFDNSIMLDNSRMRDNSQMRGKSIMCGKSEMRGNSTMHENMTLTDICSYCSDYVYPLTLSDNHIKCGCELRTIEEWKEFLDSDEVIQTPRNHPKFKVIRMALKLAIAQHELDKSEEE